MNICKVCEVEISNNRVFCSNKCKEKHRYYNTIYKKKCSICGKDFEATKGKVVCSPECSLKAQRKNTKLCPICHSEFNSRGNGVYCSEICYRTANNPTKGFMVSTCEVCGATFKTLKTTPELTCSDICSTKLFSTYINRANKEVFGTTDKSKIRKNIVTRRDLGEKQEEH